MHNNNKINDNLFNEAHLIDEFSLTIENTNQSLLELTKDYYKDYYKNYYKEYYKRYANAALQNGQINMKDYIDLIMQPPLTGPGLFDFFDEVTTEDEINNFIDKLGTGEEYKPLLSDPLATYEENKFDVNALRARFEEFFYDKATSNRSIKIQGGSGLEELYQQELEKRSNQIINKQDE